MHMRVFVHMRVFAHMRVFMRANSALSMFGPDVCYICSLYLAVVTVWLEKQIRVLYHCLQPSPIAHCLVDTANMCV